MLYRLEHPESKMGMWNTLLREGYDWKPAVSFLSNRVVAELPMPRNDDVYGEHGRRWYSAASSWEMMNHWFKNEDIHELLSLGFKLIRLEADESKDVGNEIVFTKESVTQWEDVTFLFIEGRI